MLNKAVNVSLDFAGFCSSGGGRGAVIRRNGRGTVIRRNSETRVLVNIVFVVRIETISSSFCKARSCAE